MTKTGYARALRLIRLIDLIAGQEQGTRELAALLGVSQRTVSRDLRDLEKLNVHVFRTGTGWTYRARAVPSLTPPEPFSDTERALIVAFRRLNDAERAFFLRMLERTRGASDADKTRVDDR